MYCVDLVKLSLSMTVHLTVSICWVYQHFSQENIHASVVMYHFSSNRLTESYSLDAQFYRYCTPLACLKLFSFQVEETALLEL